MAELKRYQIVKILKAESIKEAAQMAQAEGRVVSIDELKDPEEE